MNLRGRVLIADDEAPLRAIMQKALSAEPWEVHQAGDGREALDLLCAGRYDVAVLDFLMPRLNGLEVLMAARREGVDTDVVFLTGHGTIEMAVEAMKLGAQDFLTKPVSRPELVATIRALFERRDS